MQNKTITQQPGYLRPVIFLDVDGVLNTLDSSLPLNHGCLTLLAELVAKTDASIVVSSMWRLTPYTMTLLKHELDAVGLVASDVTPSLYDPPGEGGIIMCARPRWEEIQLWLKTKYGIPEKFPRFVILDDEPDFGPLSSHHVRTELQVGLTPALARDAFRILTGN